MTTWKLVLECLRLRKKYALTRCGREVVMEATTEMVVTIDDKPHKTQNIKLETEVYTSKNKQNT